MQWIAIGLVVLCLVQVSSLSFLYFKNKSLKNRIKDLENRFRVNPGYETQQFMADLLRGNALFHIQRIEPESVFIRRD